MGWLEVVSNSPSTNTHNVNGSVLLGGRRDPFAVCAGNGAWCYNMLVVPVAIRKKGSSQRSDERLHPWVLYTQAGVWIGQIFAELVI